MSVFHGSLAGLRGGHQAHAQPHHVAHALAHAAGPKQVACEALLRRHSHTHTSTTKFPKSPSKTLGDVTIGDEDTVEVEETYEYEEEQSGS